MVIVYASIKLANLYVATINKLGFGIKKTIFVRVKIKLYLVCGICVILL